MPATDHSVTVAYSATCYALTRTHTGSGSDPTTAPVNSSGCPVGQYVFGAEVHLNALPASDWQVTGWSGSDDDASSAENNSVTMPPADHSVSVAYSPICYTLTLTHTGSGGDPVATPASSAGCPAGQYVSAAVVQLRTAPDTGWKITGWSGSDDDSSSAGSNRVTMPTADHSVSAAYGQLVYTLRVRKIGEGFGTVSGDPPGIDCGADCAHEYTHNTSVRLTAHSDDASIFAGWSGACSDPDPDCQIAVQAHVLVTATFAIRAQAETMYYGENVTDYWPHSVHR